MSKQREAMGTVTHPRYGVGQVLDYQYITQSGNHCYIVDFEGEAEPRMILASFFKGQMWKEAA